MTCLNCPLAIVIATPNDNFYRLFPLIFDRSLIFSVTYDFEFGRVFENSLYDDNLECIVYNIMCAMVICTLILSYALVINIQ